MSNAQGCRAEQDSSSSNGYRKFQKLEALDSRDSGPGFLIPVSPGFLVEFLTKSQFENQTQKVSIERNSKQYFIMCNIHINLNSIKFRFLGDILLKLHNYNCITCDCLMPADIFYLIAFQCFNISIALSIKISIACFYSLTFSFSSSL